MFHRSSICVFERALQNPSLHACTVGGYVYSCIALFYLHGGITRKRIRIIDVVWYDDSMRWLIVGCTVVLSVLRFGCFWQQKLACSLGSTQ